MRLTHKDTNMEDLVGVSSNSTAHSCFYQNICVKVKCLFLNLSLLYFFPQCRKYVMYSAKGWAACTVSVCVRERGTDQGRFN